MKLPMAQEVNPLFVTSKSTQNIKAFLMSELLRTGVGLVCRHELIGRAVVEFIPRKTGIQEPGL